MTKASATYADLRLTIVQVDHAWHARVEGRDDPNSALSDGAKYETADGAKAAAISIACELFGTIVPQNDLRWCSASDKNSA